MTLLKFSSKEELLEFCRVTPLGDIPVDVLREEQRFDHVGNEVTKVIFDRCRRFDPEFCAWVDVLRERLITDEEALTFSRMFKIALPIVAVVAWLMIVEHPELKHPILNLKRIHPFVNDRLVQSLIPAAQLAPTGPSGATGSSS